MKFHWTGTNYGAAVEFFLEVEGCDGVAFDDGVLIARIDGKRCTFPADTTVEIVEIENEQD